MNSKKIITKNITRCLKNPLKSGVSGFSNIVKYFLYLSPNIDCVHSCGRIEGKRAAEVFSQMIDKTNMKKKILTRIRASSFNKFNLQGDNINFKSNCMTLKRYGSEDDLTALVRHLRNSFAHGLVYIWKDSCDNNRPYVMLDDFEKNRDTKTLIHTARIVIAFEDLEKWKAILEGEIATGE
ncbi:MAG: hypothetical protein NC177_17820 [Ruminococcus flavefaciens]|nr:hypothetical protein [Ruminococcus flavefaciens]